MLEVLMIRAFLVLADSRLVVSSAVWQLVLKSLPNKNYQRVLTKDISEQIAKWREEHDVVQSPDGLELLFAVSK